MCSVIPRPFVCTHTNPKLDQAARSAIQVLDQALAAAVDDAEVVDEGAEPAP